MKRVISILIALLLTGCQDIYGNLIVSETQIIADIEENMAGAPPEIQDRVIGILKSSNYHEGVFNLLTNVYNVKEFGAAGDGESDDTEAFKAAFEKITEDGGGAIFIPPGVFMINPVDFYDNTLIFGLGKHSVVKLIPQHLDPKVDWGILRAAGTENNPVSNVHVQNITVDGNKEAHTGTSRSHETIDFDWVSSGSIINVHVMNTTHNGIQVDGTRNVIIFGNHIEKADGWGIHLSDHGIGPHRRTENTVVALNSVERSGHKKHRGGIDQSSVSRDNIYIGNIAMDNYRNYEMKNEGAIFINNESSGATEEPDIFDGVSFYY